MNKITIAAIALLFCACPAHAQPVEREPLPAPYTLQGETDPMALGGAPAPTLPPSEALPATPPPGQDTVSTYESTPITNEGPAEIIPPASDTATSGPAPSATEYPNNNVSAVVPQDTSKFENMLFCTLKIDFASTGSGPDTKTAEKVKSYLDAHTDKVGYQTQRWGKEGEFSYCLDIKEHKNRAEIYTGLKKLLPTKSNTPPVSLYGRGFTPTGNQTRRTNN